MTKNQVKVYLIIFIVLILGLIIATFGAIFFKKNNQTNNYSEITPIISASPTTNISWTEAINLLQECKITSVFQKHDLTVTLTDKENRIYQTTEPKIDEVFNQTNHLRSDCNDIITTITE